MKFHKSISIITVLFLGINISVFSQSDTLRIQTSAQCEMCKKSIESDLSFVKGVKKSSLDMETKVITVIYNPEKTNPEAIRKSISESGYDADSVAADTKAYKRLPDCCKKD